jgi:hypothetical protein
MQPQSYTIRIRVINDESKNTFGRYWYSPPPLVQNRARTGKGRPRDYSLLKV